MSAATVWAGLDERFRTIEGIAAVLLGEPTTVHATPLLFAEYASADQIMRSVAPAHNIDGLTHIFTVWILFDTQENAQTEMQLLTLADSVPRAINIDPRLAQRLYGGYATSTSALAGRMSVASKLYRALQFTVTIKEKAAAT